MVTVAGVLSVLLTSPVLTLSWTSIFATSSGLPGEGSEPYARRMLDRRSRARIGRAAG
jgi:hypothetical protein